MTDITLARLAEALKGLAPIPRYELHCSEDVYVALRVATDERDWSAKLSRLADPAAVLGSMEIVIREEFEPGAWELRRNGEPIRSGRLGMAAS